MGVPLSSRAPFRVLLSFLYRGSFQGSFKGSRSGLLERHLSSLVVRRGFRSGGVSLTAV